MGAGKSTVGRLVAAVLDAEFIDLDSMIEEEEGSSVESLVGEDEPGFRRLECEAVAAVAGRHAVVATGGGAVLDRGSVEAMRKSGMVVWLDTGVGVLAERVGSGSGRPLLGDDPDASLRRIIEERAPSYRAAAHAVVDAGSDPETVARRVLAAWGPP